MKLTYWEFIGIPIIIGLGTLLHFAYELTNYNQFVALIAPVNESVWEHIKMAFYGMIGFALVEYIFIGRENKNFIFAKAFSSILACFLLVVLYYGYTSFLNHKLYLDIIIFVLAIVIAQLFSYTILKTKFYFTGANYLSLLILFAICMVFASYTYEPPKNNEIFIETIAY